MSLHISSPEEEAREYQTRYKFLYIILFTSVFILISRLWWLQIFKGEEFRFYSEQNLVKFQKLMAPRGRILDRNGTVLVDNHPGFEATITPQYVEDLEGVAAAISPILNVPANHVVRLVKKGKIENGSFRPVRIKDDLSRDEMARIEAMRLDYPGLDINMYIKRSYPYHETGAQLLGYVSEISAIQLPKLNEGRTDEEKFRQGDIIGKSGIEQAFDLDIRGKDGLTFVQVDARGRIADIKQSSIISALPTKVDPLPGHNITLTIDADLQKTAMDGFAAKNFIGGLVALDPNSGEILAWVNSPSFDPNNFATGISQSLWSQLTNDPFKPLRNKVIQDHYPPGSTFKPFVALAALEEKLISPSTTVFCPGYIKFGNKIYHCWNKNGHGTVNFYQALERSCNVFFYRMGMLLGIDKIFKYASQLGIGKKTGVEIRNEIAGLMPNSKWKEQTLGEPWQPGENLSNAIGQGFVLATPLQMAVAYSTIAMEGIGYKPHIVKKLADQDDKLIEETKPSILYDLTKPLENGKPLVSPTTFKQVIHGLSLVTNGNFGTAKHYKLPGIEYAGKTGTAQNFSLSSETVYLKCENRPIRQRHHGWFIAFAPTEKPLIAVAVLAEHACHGASAAPIVRDTMLTFFRKYHKDMLVNDNIQINIKAAPGPVNDE